MFLQEVDVLVVGSGAGGLTAALAASDSGCKVAVLEKAEYWGGASATSGGFLWIPMSHLASAAGAGDSEQDAFRYLRTVTASDVSDESICAFVTRGPEMLAWLEQHSHVRYRSIPYTDYMPWVSGAKLGYRTHEILPLDGRLLGEQIDSLRPTAPATLLFNRVPFTMDEVFPLLYRSPGWRRTLAKILWRYYRDVPQRIRSPRSRFLAAGNALLGRLRLSLNERDVPVHLGSRLLEIERCAQSGRICAAVVGVKGNQPQRIKIAKAIILASGGFESSDALRHQHLRSSWDSSLTGSIESNTGDCIAMGQQVGAAVSRMDSAWWGPMLKLPDEDRARLLTYERALPGSMIVNQAGQRYMNEALAYDQVASQMLLSDGPKSGTAPSYFIFDNSYRRNYPAGPLIPGIPIRLHQRGLRQILVKAGSLSELALAIGISDGTLESTIREFNQYAASGKDPLFQRGDTEYERFYGDARVTPNPCLAPLSEPPFFALPIYPGDIGTNGGLVTDEYARVLDAQHMHIPGLYATGNTTASVMGYSYPGAGATLGPAMTFGYIAGMHSTRHTE